MAQDPTNETGVRLLAAWLLMELGDDVGKECARKHIRAGTPEAIAEALTLLTVDRPYSVAAAPPWRVRLVLDSVKLEAFEDVDSVSLERIHLPEWLAQNCHEGVVLTLRELLRCGDGIDRARLAARTLAEIQDQTAIPLILERLGNTYDAQFIEALGLLKAGAAFPVLEKLLFSPVQKAPAESPEVVKRMYCEGQRPNIIDAMLRISPDRTMGVLKRFVQQDNEPEGIWYARAKIVALRTKDREQLLHELRQLLANPHMTPAGRRQVRRAMRGDPH
jgi:HEAT repeat protein